MHVAFDYQIFSEQRYGGISRYVVELAQSINRRPGHSASLSAGIHCNEYLRHTNAAGLRAYVPFKFRGSARIRRLVNGALAPVRYAWEQPDLVHATYYWKSPRISSKPLVLTVYDMIHEVHPERFPSTEPTAKLKKSAVKAADHVICISRQTQKDVIEILGVAPERTSITYLAHSMKRVEPTRLAAGDKPNILYVGSRGGYKNFAGLLAAFAASAQLKRDFKLLCFGGGHFSAGEALAIEACGLSLDQVQFEDGSDAALAKAYQNSHVFVYPSTYEGFGIPPLEAMANGCPVACSKTSSIPEVVGEAGEYFDPHDVDSIRHAIESVVYDEIRRANLIGRGRIQERRFGWDQCASDTLAVYEQLTGA